MNQNVHNVLTEGLTFQRRDHDARGAQDLLQVAQQIALELGARRRAGRQIDQRAVGEAQTARHRPWEAAQRGNLVEGSAAMAQIRENLRPRHASAES